MFSFGSFWIIAFSGIRRAVRQKADHMSGATSGIAAEISRKAVTTVGNPLAPALIFTERRLFSLLPALRSGFPLFHSLGPLYPRGQMQFCPLYAELLCHRITWDRSFFMLEDGLRLTLTIFKPGISHWLNLSFSWHHPVSSFAHQSIHHWESGPGSIQPRWSPPTLWATCPFQNSRFSQWAVTGTEFVSAQGATFSQQKKVSILCTESLVSLCHEFIRPLHLNLS